MFKVLTDEADTIEAQIDKLKEDGYNVKIENCVLNSKDQCCAIVYILKP